MTEVSPAEYDYLMRLAEERGLCPNCFHTLACCDGKCASPSEMDHVCKEEA